jgi:hypothetical protein
LGTGTAAIAAVPARFWRRVRRVRVRRKGLRPDGFDIRR